MVREKLKNKAEESETSTGEKELILFNDDFNTFDYVIESLVEVCGHEPSQAEQCALIAHFNGKCGVMTGPYEQLKMAHDELSDRDLTVKIA